MLPRSFYFLRHGETDWNKMGRIQGHSDIPLNATGKAQAAAAIRLLLPHPIDRIVASNLLRAHETAAIVNAALKKELTVDAGLKERNFGTFEGLDGNDWGDLQDELVKKGLPSEENGYPCPPEAEPYADFRVRTMTAMAGHLEQFAGENILFVAHGGIYRVLSRCLGTPLDQSPNAQPFLYKKENGGWILSPL